VVVVTGAARTIYRVPESYRSIPAGAPGPIMLVRWSGDGRWLFFAMRGERLSGPLLRIGYNLGYYGHRCWWLSC
jgi:hypothetical protein